MALMFNMMRQMTSVTAANDMRNIGTAKYQWRVINSKNASIGFLGGLGLMRGCSRAIADILRTDSYLLSSSFTTSASNAGLSC